LCRAPAPPSREPKAAASSAVGIGHRIGLGNRQADLMNFREGSGTGEAFTSASLARCLEADRRKPTHVRCSRRRSSAADAGRKPLVCFEAGTPIKQTFCLQPVSDMPASIGASHERPCVSRPAISAPDDKQPMRAYAPCSTKTRYAACGLLPNIRDHTPPAIADLSSSWISWL
jgi:hypothetical protein